MIKTYKNAFQNHGHSPNTLGWTKGRQQIRFKALCEFLKNNSSLLDYGCGFGDLYKYIVKKKLNINYKGCDVVDEFIEVGSNTIGKDLFFKIELQSEINEKFDHIICSGVFNFLYTKNKKKHQKIVFERIKHLYDSCNSILSIDFQSQFVSFVGEKAYHQEINDLALFVAENLSRRFIINHSYLPFEFCIHIFKNDKIKFPNNVFEN